MTDVEQGSQEWGALRHRVAEIFEAPASLAPTPTDVRRRSRLRLWTEPSFDNYKCWTVWGPHTADAAGKPVMLRRIIWRADLDGDRGNPMRRLQRLGKPLEPTLEVTDGSVAADDARQWLHSLPLPVAPAVSVLTPRPISLDGERYGLEIDSDRTRCRIEWFGVDRDWTASDLAYVAIARWSKEFHHWLNKLLDGT